MTQAIVEQALRNVLIGKQGWPDWMSSKAEDVAKAGNWVAEHPILTIVGGAAGIAAARLAYRAIKATAEPDNWIKVGKTAGTLGVNAYRARRERSAEQRRSSAQETPAEARQSLVTDLLETSVSPTAGDPSGITTNNGTLNFLRQMQSDYVEDPELAAREPRRKTAIDVLVRHLTVLDGEGKGGEHPAAALRRWARLPEVTATSASTTASSTGAPAESTPAPGASTALDPAPAATSTESARTATSPVTRSSSQSTWRNLLSRIRPGTPTNPTMADASLLFDDPPPAGRASSDAGTTPPGAAAPEGPGLFGRAAAAARARIARFRGSPAAPDEAPPADPSAGDADETIPLLDEPVVRLDLVPTPSPSTTRTDARSASTSATPLPLGPDHIPVHGDEDAPLWELLDELGDVPAPVSSPTPSGPTAEPIHLDGEEPPHPASGTDPAVSPDGSTPPAADATGTPATTARPAADATGTPATTARPAAAQRHTAPPSADAPVARPLESFFRRNRSTGQLAGDPSATAAAADHAAADTTVVGTPAPAVGAHQPADTTVVGTPAPAADAHQPADTTVVGTPAPAAGAHQPADTTVVGTPAPAADAHQPADTTVVGTPAPAAGAHQPADTTVVGTPAPAAAHQPADTTVVGTSAPAAGARQAADTTGAPRAAVDAAAVIPIANDDPASSEPARATNLGGFIDDAGLRSQYEARATALMNRQRPITEADLGNLFSQSAQGTNANFGADVSVTFGAGNNSDSPSLHLIDNAGSRYIIEGREGNTLTVQDPRDSSTHRIRLPQANRMQLEIELPGTLGAQVNDSNPAIRSTARARVSECIQASLACTQSLRSTERPVVVSEHMNASMTELSGSSRSGGRPTSSSSGTVDAAVVGTPAPAAGAQHAADTTVVGTPAPAAAAQHAADTTVVGTPAPATGAQHAADTTVVGTPTPAAGAPQAADTTVVGTPAPAAGAHQAADTTVVGTPTPAAAAPQAADTTVVGTPAPAAGAQHAADTTVVGTPAPAAGAQHAADTTVVGTPAPAAGAQHAADTTVVGTPAPAAGAQHAADTTVVGTPAPATGAQHAADTTVVGTPTPAAAAQHATDTTVVGTPAPAAAAQHAADTTVVGTPTPAAAAPQAADTTVVGTPAPATGAEHAADTTVVGTPTPAAGAQHAADTTVVGTPAPAAGAQHGADTTVVGTPAPAAGAQHAADTTVVGTPAPAAGAQHAADTTVVGTPAPAAGAHQAADTTVVGTPTPAAGAQHAADTTVVGTPAPAAGAQHAADTTVVGTPAPAVGAQHAADTTVVGTPAPVAAAQHAADTTVVGTPTPAAAAPQAADTSVVGTPAPVAAAQHAADTTVVGTPAPVAAAQHAADTTVVGTPAPAAGAQHAADTTVVGTPAPAAGAQHAADTTVVGTPAPATGAQHAADTTVVGTPAPAAGAPRTATGAAAPVATSPLEAAEGTVIGAPTMAATTPVATGQSTGTGASGSTAAASRAANEATNPGAGAPASASPRAASNVSGTTPPAAANRGAGDATNPGAGAPASAAPRTASNVSGTTPPAAANRSAGSTNPSTTAPTTAAPRTAGDTTRSAGTPPPTSSSGNSSSNTSAPSGSSDGPAAHTTRPGGRASRVARAANGGLPASHSDHGEVRPPRNPPPADDAVNDTTPTAPDAPVEAARPAIIPQHEIARRYFETGLNVDALYRPEGWVNLQQQAQTDSRLAQQAGDLNPARQQHSKDIGPDTTPANHPADQYPGLRAPFNRPAEEYLRFRDGCISGQPDRTPIEHLTNILDPYGPQRYEFLTSIPDEMERAGVSSELLGDTSSEAFAQVREHLTQRAGATRAQGLRNTLLRFVEGLEHEAGKDQNVAEKLMEMHNATPYGQMSAHSQDASSRTGTTSTWEQALDARRQTEAGAIEESNARFVEHATSYTNPDRDPTYDQSTGERPMRGRLVERYGVAGAQRGTESNDATTPPDSTNGQRGTGNATPEAAHPGAQHPGTSGTPAPQAAGEAPAALPGTGGTAFQNYVRPTKPLGLGTQAQWAGPPPPEANQGSSESDAAAAPVEPAEINLAASPLNRSADTETAVGEVGAAPAIEVTMKDLRSLQGLVSRGDGPAMEEHDLTKKIDAQFKVDLAEAKGNPAEESRIRKQQDLWREHPRTYLDQFKTELANRGGRGDLHSVMKAVGFSAAMLLLIDLSVHNNRETPLDRANAARDRSPD